jgi:fluoroacetyl-CoA thioesterase
MAKEVPIGTRAEVTHTVEHRHTLAAITPDLPPVLATPWMIAWMEHACYQAQFPYCEDGETTVGTAIHVDHRAPTTIGQTVIAEAVLEKVDGRFFYLPRNCSQRTAAYRVRNRSSGGGEREEIHGKNEFSNRVGEESGNQVISQLGNWKPITCWIFAPVSHSK